MNSLSSAVDTYLRSFTVQCMCLSVNLIAFLCAFATGYRLCQLREQCTSPFLLGVVCAIADAVTVGFISVITSLIALVNLTKVTNDAGFWINPVMAKVHVAIAVLIAIWFSEYGQLIFAVTCALLAIAPLIVCCTVNTGAIIISLVRTQ